mgnify:CR=1 FL=1
MCETGAANGWERLVRFYSDCNKYFIRTFVKSKAKRLYLNSVINLELCSFIANLILKEPIRRHKPGVSIYSSNQDYKVFQYIINCDVFPVTVGKVMYVKGA